MKKIGRFQFALLFYVGAFLVLEAGLRMLPKKAQTNALFQVSPTDSVKSLPWYPQWKGEEKQLTRIFQAYEIYKLAPFEGTHINISGSGKRHTLAAKNQSQGIKVSTVGLFGGSLVWGTAARDEHTIPSELQRLSNLNTLKAPLQVENHGEIGYVFSQALMRVTRNFYEEKELPETLVFFMGPNDMASAVFNWAQGSDNPQGLLWEEEKYRYLFKSKNTGEISFSDIAKKSQVVRSSIRVLENMGLKQAPDKGSWRSPTEKDLERLSTKVALTYTNILKLAHSTAQSQNRKAIFVMPPMLWFKKSLSEEEKRIVEQNEAYANYFKSCHRKIIENVEKISDAINWHDMADLFESDPETRFSDLFHYTEAANALIAQELSTLLFESPKYSAGKKSLGFRYTQYHP